MADPNTPSWLSNDESLPTVQQDPIQTVAIDDGGLAPSGGADDSMEASSTTVEEKDLPHVILMMRLANMGAAVALITCAVRTLLTKRNDFFCSWREP
jgi:hypothetical protein